MLTLGEVLEIVLVTCVVAVVCVLIVFGCVDCGPVSVQIKQEVWQCEARSENSAGDVTFSGCKRDGESRDVQDAQQPASGPDIIIEPSDLDKIGALLN